ncbi:MAG: magnesium/cobalt transporter CorA [Chloroflexi bacterium]|nr:MAG: magnesium/cobalt transporter CorA [Chloroflexota bacterium]
MVSTPHPGPFPAGESEGRHARAERRPARWGLEARRLDFFGLGGDNTRTLGSGDSMGVEVLSHRRMTWVNIEKPSPEDMAYLRERYPFHPLDLEDCLSRIERPKVDEYDEYLFIIMQFPVFDSTRRVSRPGEVDIFIGAGYLVSVHDGNLWPIAKFFDDCQADEAVRERHMGGGASLLLHDIVDRLVDYCFPILYKVDANIREIEEDIFTEDLRGVVQEISWVRRDVISLQRIVKPQIAIVANLEHKDRPFIREELEVYFGDVLDHLYKAWDMLEDHRDVVEGLSDTANVLTSFRINDVIKILTIISVIMLPLTLVSGIYGMNIPLPLMDHPLAFLFILLLMVAMAGSMILYFKKRRWI